MKVLLVQPPTHSSLGLQAFMLPEPLGLETIGASLRLDHEVRLLDMRLEPGLRQELKSFKPDAVGVSACFTADAYSVYRVLEMVKEYNPGTFTFVGGQHATMAHRDFFGRADAVVLGEGEVASQELLRCWEKGRPLDEVAGLAFRRGDQWVQTAPRPLIENLDETPLPARSLSWRYLPHYFIGTRCPCASLETSRGCPYRCSFCVVWRFYRQTYRSRSPQRVLQELRQIKSQDVFFTDDNALAQPSRMEKLHQLIREAGLGKRYLMQLRADSIVRYRDLLAKWREIGLETVFVGFESITQRGLDELNKRLQVKYVEEAINTLRQLGIAVMGSFIIKPEFGKEDFALLKRFVKRMKLPMPVFSILTPLPGSVLYEEKSQSGEITSRNYELYDLLHSVLPTRLKLRQFYREFLSLNLSSYMGYATPMGFIKRLSMGKVGIFFKQAWIMLRLIRENHPGALARHHQLAPGELSAKRFPSK